MIDWWEQASGEQERHTTSLKIFESSNLHDESNNECHHFTKYHPIQRILLLHCEQMRWQFSHDKTSIWKCTCQAKHAGNAPKKFSIFRAGNKVSFAIPSYFRHLVTQFCRQFRILALFLMLQKKNLQLMTDSCWVAQWLEKLLDTSGEELATIILLQHKKYHSNVTNLHSRVQKTVILARIVDQALVVSHRRCALQPFLSIKFIHFPKLWCLPRVW